jgi:fructosamine-3-kinase
MPSAAKDAIAEWIEAEVPDAGKVTNISGRGSSGWASSSRYETDSGMSFFVKQAKGRDDSMFKGEALGLRAMYDTHTLRIPQVFYYGALSSNPAGGTCIIMEHLDFSSGSDQAALGQQLARMHLADAKDPDAASGKFGFPVDNTIGGTPQANGWMDNWVDFYRERRLRPMLKYANDSEMSRLGDVLMRNLDSLFQGIEVKPSVLHGDLWSGNIGSADGQPTVYDPAVYYGHHEAEFGMSWCAGFGGSFWSAYHELIPRAEGFEERAKLYRFYHLANHYVLFGGGYRSSAMSELSSLTRTLK